MGRTRSRVISWIAAGVFLLLIFAAGAEAINIKNPLGEGATFDTIIKNITKFANSLLAPLSALMMLIAGFLYLTAGGNQEKIKLAHKTIIWALVGIGLVILANSARIIIEQVLTG